MTKRNKQINQIVKKIESISEEDLKKLEAFVAELKNGKEENSKGAKTVNKRLQQKDFSFIQARKITEKLKSSLAEEIINERALEQ